MRNHIGKLDVEVRLVNTDDQAVVEEHGMTRGVCVDGQPLIARLASGREVVRAVKRRLEEATRQRKGINVRFEVMKEHRSNYPSPIALLKGQAVIVGERYDGPENWNGWIYCRTTCGTQECWVPEQIIKGRGDTGLILDDYTARELDADIGEKVLGLRELNDWIWCEKATGGDAGWLPASNLRPSP